MGRSHKVVKWASYDSEGHRYIKHDNIIRM